MDPKAWLKRIVSYALRLAWSVKAYASRIARMHVKLWHRLRYRRLLRSRRRVPRIRRDLCWCGGTLNVFSPCPSYGVCEACGTYVNRQPPDPAWIQALYSLDYYWFAKQRATCVPDIARRARLYISDGRLDAWLSAIKRYGPAGGSVLEVGCAPGILLERLVERGYQCTGMEVSQDVARWVERQTGIRVLVGTFPEVKPGSFDLFLALDVLEHCYDPVAFVEGAREVLNPGGVAVLQAPIVRQQQGYQIDKPFGEAGMRFFNPEEHMFILTSSAVRKLVKGAGLEILDDSLRWQPGHEILVLRRADLQKA